MKQIPFILIFSLLALLFSCSAPRGTIKVKTHAETTAEADSIEYDLETFDIKFESWYKTQNSPANHRAQSYYENWNRQYVSAWNAKSMTSGNSFFEPIIGYYPGTDYGFELNHELFYYFQYVENVLKIKIMSVSPRVVLF